MQHLVFADIEYNGFVIGVYNSYSEAKIVMDKIWALGDPSSPFLLEDLYAFYKYMEFESYKLNEDNMFENQSKIDQSNGYYTVGIVEMNDKITVESYIEKRNS
ncbi:MAG: hypothetical protein HQ541_00905 [Mariniphaga sp.]|nr:hypothetical protein [Mariniphaga sp.]